MNDLSLKGVARRYGSITNITSITGGFSVLANIFGGPITGNQSLRSRLESMARREHSFSMSECIYGWTAAFEQTWTHIRIRIRLNPDADVTNATMNTLRTMWQNGIQNIWSDQWGCGRAGELACSLTFEVVWVNTGQHHAVRVNTGTKCIDIPYNLIRCRTNVGRWHTADTSRVVAHEYGHMIGLVDEYAENPPCPDRSPVNTGTIMDIGNSVPARMMTRFADNINSNVVAI